MSAARPAEYKQVTVLFADVVRSMDMAAALGPERLREVMAELLDRSSAVVKRLHGTVDKFTGDGVMAVFGAPIALEDHALRACMAALEIQAETAKLAADVSSRDGVDLQLRIGLNSGQVIAGEIGSTSAGYTAIGQQVGLAQRMEAAAPPGGVMMTESTARLVENIVSLGQPELVAIKGAEAPFWARRLLAIGEHHARRRSDSPLVGRTWELSALTALLDEAVGGSGSVVAVVGPPGIGKSRLVRETVAEASGRGVPAYTAYCESHTSDIPFQAVARLMRATTGTAGMSPEVVRQQIRARLPRADPEDLRLIDDLLGVGQAAAARPDIGPDARRRRLTALINSAALAQTSPTIVVVEDAHWIDAASESMLAEFMAVIPQVPSLMLVTYRPEYHGALSRIPGAQTIALRPLSDAHTTALTAELVGSGPELAGLVGRVVHHAAGNPFFAEEIVRDLSERGVLDGEPGAYTVRGPVDDVEVPANLQATIGARIDRLSDTAKRTLNAASVIGLRFDVDLLKELVGDADIAPLVAAEIVDQVAFTDPAEYAFRHPLTRTVAYESQLKSDRARLHRRLAATIESRGGTDENAALIAQHLEAAGDLHAAFDWQMRAATWFTFRNFVAAQSSWFRARDVADRLPDSDPDKLPMRIAPRALLCANEYRIRSGHADTAFAELRKLCAAAGDERSLAIGLAGVALATQLNLGPRPAAGLAAELIRLLQSIDDPKLTVSLSVAPLTASIQGGSITVAGQLAQSVIDTTGGTPSVGGLITISPVATAFSVRGITRWSRGLPGWREDLERAVEVVGAVPPAFRSGTFWHVYLYAVPNGVLTVTQAVVDEAAEIFAGGQQFGEQITIDLAKTAVAIVLVHQGGADRDVGAQLLQELHDEAADRGLMMPQNVPLIDLHLARERGRLGDVDGAIEMARAARLEYLQSGDFMWFGTVCAALTEMLLLRGAAADLDEAREVVDGLAAVPVEPGVLVYDIWVLRLRALLAQAEGDHATYHDYRVRYREMAADLGFQGHMAWSAEMV